MKWNPENILESTDSTLAHKPCQGSPMDRRLANTWNLRNLLWFFSICFSRRRKVPRRSCWSLRGVTAQETGFSLLSGHKCHFTQMTGHQAAQNATVSLKSQLQQEQPNGEKLVREDSNGTKEGLHVWPGHLSPKNACESVSCILGNQGLQVRWQCTSSWTLCGVTLDRTLLKSQGSW